MPLRPIEGEEKEKMFSRIVESGKLSDLLGSAMPAKDKSTFTNIEPESLTIEDIEKSKSLIANSEKAFLKCFSGIRVVESIHLKGNEFVVLASKELCEKLKELE